MITVIIKRSRITHHFKFWGGLLNPNKQYYTIKREGNTVASLALK